MAKQKFLNELNHPSISREEAIKLLSMQIEKGNELLANRTLNAANYSSWELLTKNYLEKSFGSN